MDARPSAAKKAAYEDVPSNFRAVEPHPHTRSLHPGLGGAISRITSAPRMEPSEGESQGGSEVQAPGETSVARSRQRYCSGERRTTTEGGSPYTLTAAPDYYSRKQLKHARNAVLSAELLVFAIVLAVLMVGFGW